MLTHILRDSGYTFCGQPRARRKVVTLSNIFAVAGADNLCPDCASAAGV